MRCCDYKQREIKCKPVLGRVVSARGLRGLSSDGIQSQVNKRSLVLKPIHINQGNRWEPVFLILLPLKDFSSIKRRSYAKEEICEIGTGG
jgi:hypothetical protein